GWVNLNQVHLHQFGADVFCQLQPVTSCSRLVGRLVILKVGAEAFDVFLRSTEATGCQNHRLSTDLLRKVAGLNLDPVDPAVRVLQELNNLGAVKDRNVFLGDYTEEAVDQEATNRRHTCRSVGPLLGHPPGDGDVIQLDVVVS